MMVKRLALLILLEVAAILTLSAWPCLGSDIDEAPITPDEHDSEQRPSMATTEPIPFELLHSEKPEGESAISSDIHQSDQNDDANIDISTKEAMGVTSHDDAAASSEMDKAPPDENLVHDDNSPNEESLLDADQQGDAHEKGGDSTHTADSTVLLQQWPESCGVWGVYRWTRPRANVTVLFRLFSDLLASTDGGGISSSASSPGNDEHTNIIQALSEQLDGSLDSTIPSSHIMDTLTTTTPVTATVTTTTESIEAILAIHEMDDDLASLFEDMEAPDELDMATGSSFQEVFLGQTSRIVLQRVVQSAHGMGRALRHVKIYVVQLAQERDYWHAVRDKVDTVGSALQVAGVATWRAVRVGSNMARTFANDTWHNGRAVLMQWRQTESNENDDIMLGPNNQPPLLSEETRQRLRRQLVDNDK